MSMFCQLRKKGDRDLFIFVLFVCILVGTSVQPQEHQDERQIKIRNYQQEIERNERRLEEIERQLGEPLDGEHREGLEREKKELLNSNRELDKKIRDIEKSNVGHRPNNGPPPTFIESIINALKSPVVWASIIGAIGGIIAALIGIKKRK
jgi:hypothetical protein